MDKGYQKESFSILARPNIPTGRQTFIINHQDRAREFTQKGQNLQSKKGVKKHILSDKKDKIELHDNFPQALEPKKIESRRLCRH